MTPDDEPGWRRLTQAEIEDLRAEMRAAGKWMKEEMAKRRREHRLEEARRVAQEGYTDLMVDGAPSPHQPDTTLRWLID